MKKSFMTRALATGLSLAMAFSLSAATNVSVASAAAKPAMKSTTMTVKVGQSKNYQATAATQKAYKITAIKMSAAGKTKATVKINSSKKSIKVTGKAATKGSNVIVTFKNNSTKKLTKVTTKVVVKDETPVETVAKISDVKQKTFTNFDVTMTKALETVTASDFTMVRDDDNQVITVKSASLDATDKTKVSLTVYTSLTDAKTYTVTYTAADEAKTQSSAKVTVTDGTVANVNLTPVEITANKATKIEYQTLDANGVVISQQKVTDRANNIDVTWDSLLGTMDNSKSEYILYNVGDTAKFTVTYHTYKYDTTTGAELGVITKEFTVTAVKDASVITQYTYTAAINKPFDWSKVTPKQTIALDDTVANSAQRKAWFLIKDSNGANVTTTCEYTVESSDNSIVVADGTVANGVELSPVNKGSAYLMIKDKDGKVVHTLPITVGDKRTISTFKLSAPVVNVATSAAVASPWTCVYTDVIAKDQYGENIVGARFEAENKTGNGSTKIELPDDPNNTTGSIRVSSYGASGSETYIIKATDKNNKSMTTSLRVNSITPSGTSTYSVVFLDDTTKKVVSSIDTTISEVNGPAPADQNLQAVIVEKKSGVVVGKLANGNVTSVKVVKNDGSTVVNVVSGSSTCTVATSAAVTDSAVVGVTGAAATAADKLKLAVRTYDNVSNVDKNLGVGTYTIVYELLGADGAAGSTRKDRASASFTVTDTQNTASAVVKSTNCGNAGGNIANYLKSSDGYISYYYGDVEVTVNTVTNVNRTISNGNKNAYVSNVTVQLPVAETNYTVTSTVSVNKTFITTGTAWN